MKESKRKWWYASILFALLSILCIYGTFAEIDTHVKGIEVYAKVKTMQSFSRRRSTGKDSYLFVDYKGEEYRIHVGDSLYFNISRGDMIKLSYGPVTNTLERPKEMNYIEAFIPTILFSLAAVGCIYKAVTFPDKR